ncbi:MAG TPA: peptidyl-tRNA hydrolase, partial [Candidatus Hodarchaeales archaeon]|nr:peptidyl-tRNA hydrolase [Candidatus Hodarchaeales archaeon]
HEGERVIRDLNKDILLVSETVLAAILSLKVPLVVPVGKRPFYSNFGDFENLIEWWAKNRRLQVKTVVLNKISPISVFIVAREDLGLGKGKLGAQVAHGLVAATLQPTQVNEYLSIFLKNRSPQFDIFTVSNEGTLASMLQLANRLSLNAALIADAGHTQIPRGTVTVLALGPAPRYYLERFIGEWNTVKRMNL